MPILTTTYPLMNSTFNVSQHTQRLIQEKMLVAAETCDRILEGDEQWEALFKVSIGCNNATFTPSLISISEHSKFNLESENQV